MSSSSAYGGVVGSDGRLRRSAHANAQNKPGWIDALNPDHVDRLFELSGDEDEAEPMDNDNEGADDYVHSVPQSPSPLSFRLTRSQGRRKRSQTLVTKVEEEDDEEVIYDSIVVQGSECGWSEGDTEMIDADTAEPSTEKKQMIVTLKYNPEKMKKGRKTGKNSGTTITVPETKRPKHTRKKSLIVGFKVNPEILREQINTSKSEFSKNTERSQPRRLNSAPAEVSTSTASTSIPAPCPHEHSVDMDLDEEEPAAPLRMVATAPVPMTSMIETPSPKAAKGKRTTKRRGKITSAASLRQPETVSDSSFVSSEQVPSSSFLDLPTSESLPAPVSSSEKEPTAQSKQAGDEEMASISTSRSIAQQALFALDSTIMMSPQFGEASPPDLMVSPPPESTPAQVRLHQIHGFTPVNGSEVLARLERLSKSTSPPSQAPSQSLQETRQGRRQKARRSRNQPPPPVSSDMAALELLNLPRLLPKDSEDRAGALTERLAEEPAIQTPAPMTHWGYGTPTHPVPNTPVITSAGHGKTANYHPVYPSRITLPFPSPASIPALQPTFQPRTPTLDVPNRFQSLVRPIEIPQQLASPAEQMLPPMSALQHQLESEIGSANYRGRLSPHLDDETFLTYWSVQEQYGIMNMFKLFGGNDRKLEDPDFNRRLSAVSPSHHPFDSRRVHDILIQREEWKARMESDDLIVYGR